MDMSLVANANLRSSIGTAVAKEALDAAKLEGELANALLEAAGQVASNSGASRGAVSPVPTASETGIHIDATG